MKIFKLFCYVFTVICYLIMIVNILYSDFIYIIISILSCFAMTLNCITVTTLDK